MENAVDNRVLIIDDDSSIRFTLALFLKKKGFIPIEAESGKEGLDAVRRLDPSVILLDLRMPDMDGLETLGHIREIDPQLPVIIVSAHGDIQTAVDAMKHGAYDFITKPPDFDRLFVTVERAIERKSLEDRIKTLNAAVETSIESMLGKSEAMKKVIEKIHQVAFSDFSVIIQGETGTGKTTVAHLIHDLSKRSKGSFVTVDVGAIPESLVESELFGYTRGAFTGAEKAKQGYFEAAQRGTILIDELQNMPLSVQPKLLRAVEEKRIYALGSTQPVEIDVRVLGASNRDLRQAVMENRFREDLFYRFGEFVIDLPPLRERIEDIPVLADKFLREAAESLEKNISVIADEALGLLTGHRWPGNVRELKNAMRKAALQEERGKITKKSLDFLHEKGQVRDDGRKKESGDADRTAMKEADEGGTVVPLRETLREAERRALIRALNQTTGNKFRAASLLQVDYKTLLKKMKDYDIRMQWG